MQPIEIAAIHHFGVTSVMITAQTTMLIVAAHLARLLTDPVACQSRITGPNCRCACSQRWRRAEPRIAAQAEMRMKTVVGKPGTKIPIMPRPKLV